MDWSGAVRNGVDGLVAEWCGTDRLVRIGRGWVQQGAAVIGLAKYPKIITLSSKVNYFHVFLAWLNRYITPLVSS